MKEERTALLVTSPAFAAGEAIPKRYTGFGEDVSPPLRVEGLCREAVSLAVVMTDLDVPLAPNYPHWLIWNLPVRTELPEGIPHGAELPELEGAQQGVAYGRNRYRGPKPPVFERRRHRYVFRVYALDCRLTLESSARRPALLAAMEGHILQEGSLMGIYRR